jgi:hypothetical protein
MEEIKQIDLFVSLYRKFSGEAGNEAVVANESAAIPMPPAKAAAASSRRVSRQGMPQHEFEPFVRALLLENGRPMQPSEILQGFASRGRVIGGVDEIGNLKTKLWRARNKIANIPGAGYWPADVRCDAVSYEPPVLSG